jgi:hypothetical protein
MCWIFCVIKGWMYKSKLRNGLAAADSYRNPCSIHDVPPLMSYRQTDRQTHWKEGANTSYRVR